MAVSININDQFLSTTINLLSVNTQLQSDLFPTTNIKKDTDDLRIYAADINLPEIEETIFPRVIVEVENVQTVQNLQQPMISMHDIFFAVHVWVRDEEGGDPMLGVLEDDVRTALLGQFVNGIHFIGGFALEQPSGYMKERDQETSAWHAMLKFFLQSAYLQ